MVNRLLVLLVSNESVPTTAWNLVDKAVVDDYSSCPNKRLVLFDALAYAYRHLPEANH